MRILKTKQGTEIIRLTPARCNIFLIRSKDHVIMVDTGMSPDRLSINRFLRKNKAKPEVIILTHTHFDHASNAAWMKKHYGAKVITHSSEARSLSEGNTPIPEGTLGLTKGLVSIGRKLPSWFTYEPCDPDVVINERLDLSSYGIDGYIIHTPGHCPGEIAIVIENEVVITGDSLMGVVPGKIFPVFADDVDNLLRSWKMLIDTGCRTFLPGHGRPVKIETLSREYNKRMSGNRT